jgi:hypothetical protein
MIREAERFYAGTDSGFHIFSVRPGRVITAGGMRMKIGYHIFFLSKSFDRDSIA